MSGQIDLAPNVREASEARKRLRQQQQQQPERQPREIHHVLEETATARSMAPTYEYVDYSSGDYDESVPEPPTPVAVDDVKKDKKTEKTEKTVTTTTQWSVVIPWTLVVLSWTLVLVLALLVATQAAPPSSKTTAEKDNIYPLWTAAHDTASVPLALQDSSIARPLLAALEYSFRGQFEMTEQYECLCMTHLVVPHFFGTTRPSYQVCGVYNRPARQLYMMVNPLLVGVSNQTDAYLESSVACGTREQSVKRARYIFVEWTDPASRLTMYARFIGLQAAAIQLALDEMHKGVRYC